MTKLKKYLFNYIFNPQILFWTYFDIINVFDIKLRKIELNLSFRQWKKERRYGMFCLYIFYKINRNSLTELTAPPKEVLKRGKQHKMNGSDALMEITKHMREAEHHQQNFIRDWTRDWKRSCLLFEGKRKKQMDNLLHKTLN